MCSTDKMGFRAEISKLHTYSVRRGFASGSGRNISVEKYQEPDGMYVVWLSPSERGGFTGAFREAEMCPGFPPPQAARVTVVSGKKGLWVVDYPIVWYNSDVVRLRNKGGKSTLTGS